MPSLINSKKTSSATSGLEYSARPKERFYTKCSFWVFLIILTLLFIWLEAWWRSPGCPEINYVQNF
jgi:hypothetical protein